MRTIHKTHLKRFFAYANERYSILLRRRAGDPPPWTTDPILQQWRFCNVFREDDRTTAWFRENIRWPMKQRKAVMLATIAFRAFNRIETGKILQPFLLRDDWDLPRWRELLVAHHEAGNPVVTGAYMIKTAPKLSKIDGVLYQLREAKLREPQLLQWHANTPLFDRSQQDLWAILREFPYMGDFTAAEVICDLIHTDMLRNPSDLHTWTNPGPGCAAGIGQLLHGDPDAYNRHSRRDREVMMNIMGRFLEAANNDEFWPADWPRWNLHTVEFQFCELWKYIRAQQGRQLKRKYKHDVVDAEPVCD